MDPRPPDPRPSALHLTPSYMSLLFFPFSFRSPVYPSLNSRMLLGFAHWKHKSYARETTISSKQAIKRTVIFLNLQAFTFAMLYLSTIRIILLRICKLFFNSLLNFLLIVLFYFLFLFRQIALINVILFHFLHFSSLFLSIYTFILFSLFPLPYRLDRELYGSNDDINRLYLES